jgi:hypothetical protein
MDYTNALAITVALSLLVVALQAWGLRRKVTVRSRPDTKRGRKGEEGRFLDLKGTWPC